MNSKIAGIVLLVNLLVPGILFAEEAVDGETIKKVLAGNTVEGKLVKWGTTFKMYFTENGYFKRVDSLNNKESGEWEINSQSKLCILLNKKRCRIVKKRDDGGYNVYSNAGELKMTFDKVLPGDPHNLK